jgi:hypothetical protein
MIVMIILMIIVMTIVMMIVMMIVRTIPVNKLDRCDHNGIDTVPPGIAIDIFGH